MVEHLQGKRIMYIEDDTNNRELVQTALTPHGVVMEFDQWAFPDVALTKIYRFKPDLILLDLMFPTWFTGFDVYDRMESHPLIGDIPVVIVSASDPTQSMAQARKRGMHGYMTKPINVMIFPQQISDILDGKQIWLDH
ncbi:MAG: response regulator [Chloroflexota bacterium]